ncbi:MAG: glycosyltransferase family 9 protein [Victivallales bacterium]|nr:glycosyltransferase family 9 protein [Victivallales bacterium]
MTRLLVIKPSSLGDVIHALPALALIRRRLGADLTRVSWIVNESFSDLLGLAPGIDRIVKFPRKQIWKRGVIRSFKRVLQSEEYDVAIDFQGLLRSGLMAYFSHAPRRIGFADGREFSPLFYTEAISIAKGHAVEKNLQLASAAFPDGNDVIHTPTGPLLAVPEEQLKNARVKLDATDHTPVLAIGHSSRWNSKNWPVAFFAKVLDNVVKEREDTRCWLLGTASETKRAEAVAAACRIAKPLNFTGQSSMTELAALLAASTVLLTNDSGPMHLAAALNVPTVALFGATNPNLTGPFGPTDFHTVFCSKCSESPCFRHDCPYGESRCSEGTDPQTVALAILKKLNQSMET